MTAPIAFNPIGNTVNVAASTSTGNVTIGTVGNQVRVLNASNSIAFIAFSSAAAGATASTSTSTPVLPNSAETFTVDPAANSAAAILASGTGTVYFTRGEGQ